MRWNKNWINCIRLQNHNKMKRFFGLFLLFPFLFPSSLYAGSVYIDSTSAAIAAIPQATLSDIRSLFSQAHLPVTDTLAQNCVFILRFELEKDSHTYNSFYDANTKENQGFRIHAFRDGQSMVIRMEAQSVKGLSNAVYYWMQNYLGFAFYHPKETYIPDLSHYFADTFSVCAAPRFNKIGFHIHSQHPLEITEALLNENTPNGQEEVKQYIDWLCRNGQNYFEFCLLRSVDLKNWVPYFKPIVEYAHQRGIICGLDLSFHMIQQRAFQLYKNFPSSFHKKDRQITDNIHTLMQIPWDIWNVEFATTEFSHKNQEMLHQQQTFLYQSMLPYKVHLTTRKHVVQDQNLLSGASSYQHQQTDMDSAYGMFIHTVMFYSLSDSSAPVYRNKNFSYLRDQLIASNKYRDTWFFPESAYWITFDNSVPMFLLPYLEARLKDIQFADSIGVNGHLTFSSGWEWNYWLIDWSIARWCWKSDAADKQHEYALQFLDEVLRDTACSALAGKAAALQDSFIKHKELIKVMDAQTITDEIGGKLNLEFHPRPEYPYKYIMNKAKPAELDFMRKKYIAGLDEFVRSYNALRKAYAKRNGGRLSDELLRSLDITALRAEHRKYTLQYLIDYRSNKLMHQKQDISAFLDSARQCRMEAQELVNAQESQYRYPVSRLGRQRKSKTVYDFGYLYPVSRLHFWEREELQARHDKWKFWYKNIWDVLKIIGVKK